MGALDVCPFIPISGVSEEECVQVSKNFGARLGEEVSSSVCFFLWPKISSFHPYVDYLSQLSVPVFLYGAASTRNYRWWICFCIYSCMSVYLCHLRKKRHIWKSGIFQENNAPDQSRRVRGSGREGWHQQNSQLKIIFHFLFVYIEQYWYGPPCRPHLITTCVQLKEEKWAPDFGPATFVPTWGGTVTGVKSDTFSCICWYCRQMFRWESSWSLTTSTCWPPRNRLTGVHRNLSAPFDSPSKPWYLEHMQKSRNKIIKGWM